jgi:nitroimidazol reductase NimA-like FMN-containing flavoprotein (pyridoxamine 5'-phosphate oxidase superfamily)
MRRKDRLIESMQEIEAILSEGELGYLASCGEDNQPMSTPVNYVYSHGKIIFHCALLGKKLDNIGHNPKVGFTVSLDAQIDRVKMTTYYRCVMAEGIAHIIDDPKIKAADLKAIAQRLAEHAEECSDDEVANTGIVEIEVTSLNGKRNMPK